MLILRALSNAISPTPTGALSAPQCCSPAQPSYLPPLTTPCHAINCQRHATLSTQANPHMPHSRGWAVGALRARRAQRMGEQRGAGHSERGAEERGDTRHAPSRRLRYRSGAYHGLLLRHCQRQGMFDVPPRHQPRSTIIKVSARTRADIFFAFFLAYMQKNV